MRHAKRLIAFALCLTATAGFAQQPQADPEQDCAAQVAAMDFENVEFSGAVQDTAAVLAQHREALLQHCRALRQHEEAVQHHREALQWQEEALRRQREALGQGAEEALRQRRGAVRRHGNAADAKPPYTIRVTAAAAGAQPTVEMLKWDVGGRDQRAFSHRETPFDIEVNSNEFELVFQRLAGGGEISVELLYGDAPVLTGIGERVALQHDEDSGKVRASRGSR